MAFSFDKLAIVFSLAASFLLQMAVPSIAVDDQQLNTICSGTTDPPFCTQVLKSDRGTPSSDLRGLAQIAIKLTSSFAGQTLNTIKKLQSQSGDPALRRSYSDCAMYYGMVINLDLVSATTDLSRGDVRGVDTQARVVKMRGQTCEQAFPSKPSPIANYNNELGKYSGIIIAVVSTLTTPPLDAHD